MWKVDTKNNIRMTRGDTPTFSVALANPDGTAYVPVAGDTIIFVLKESIEEDAEILLEKSIPTDTLELSFAQEDTQPLEFKMYYYEISLNNDNTGYHDTFITATPFYITEELY